MSKLYAKVTITVILKFVEVLVKSVRYVQHNVFKSVYPFTLNCLYFLPPPHPYYYIIILSLLLVYIVLFSSDCLDRVSSMDIVKRPLYNQGRLVILNYF